jgi:Zn-dependent peptidase ImmA (M78 family)/transcriptional regulator with XRE-family HTH domain
VSIDEARRAAAGFDRTRLTTGRELRGMSQVDLARAVTGITAASISQFENGHTRPSPQTLDRIAGTLAVPVKFFARSRHPARQAAPDAFFRSLRSTTLADRRRARALAGLVHELVVELEDHVTLPDYDVRSVTPADDGDIERVAAELRQDWEIPHGPIDNVVRTLEVHGLVTARFRVDAHQVDAFSVPYPDRPVVVLGADKERRDRSRFDAAHELGHLVMHRDVEPGSKTVEAQAQKFAAAFLMPADDIASALPSRADWPRLLALKATWHVSLAALLMRSKTLGRMSDGAYLQGVKAMSARGWRTNEPGDLGAPEVPVLLPAAVRAATKIGVTLDELASSVGLPRDQLRDILGPSLDPRPRVNI